MDNYLEEIIKDYPLVIKTKSKKHKHYLQKGGDIKNFVPSGGFPPIYFCDTIKQEDDVTLKPREYSTHKTAVSIKDIMKKRRDVTPVL